ncbi:protein phosphatase 1 regulatory subunit 37 [Entomortierella parvispora]|uniref:Protein phosphatase 1 regulatory subunit 37 n=1 Tax=Entomortierella parvispora TaxID=205924 RepID=A0A9P3HAC1_9FUNG|nr:protein phosphatase 1 regulatory subunit 37 [Entomortierella parvispora]
MIGIQRKETCTDMDPQTSPSSAPIDPKAAAAAIVAASVAADANAIAIANANASMTNGDKALDDEQDTDKDSEELEHDPSSPTEPPMPSLDPIHSSTATDPLDDSKERAPADALKTSATLPSASDRDQPPPATGSEDHPQHPEMIIIGTKTKLKRPSLRPIDLGSTPSKSILRKESSYPFIEQPVRNPIFKSQWLQSTVSKLAVISGPAVPTAYTADQPSMFRKLVAQATAATQATPGSPSTNPGSSPQQRLQQTNPGPPVFANNERRPLLESHDSSSSILSTKALKRVRFSVGQLTTEHVFYHDDAYESAEETEPRPVQINTVVQPKEVMTTSDGVVVDDNIYTAKEIMNYYLAACNNREEFPVDRLVSEMRSASNRQSNPLLTTIDLTGELLLRKTLDPISDVLTLEFGLSHLVLDNCGLEDDTLKMLLYSLLLTDTLTTLSIQDNKKIKSIGFKYISVFVKKTKSLKSLNVSGINMDKKAIEFLAHALKVGRLGFGSRLEDLRVDRCGLRGNLLETLAPAIRESNLRQVSMRSNRIGTTGGVWIGVLMRDYDDLPNKPIPNNNEEQGFRRVFPGVANPELLKRTRGVEVLDISDNDLRQGADYVAQTLRRNMSLKHLIMANNNLDPARLVVIADALKLNIGLETLDLSYNRMCGPVVTGINALTSKLAYNKTLTKLSLSNTGLQSEGAIALAEFLPETRSLTQLDLTGNDLVDIAGVMALSVSIRMNKSLTCLDMNVPPNDAEFARLSRDILRACIRNMEEKTGSNAGMPSPDDLPTNTIFRQPSPTLIPEPRAPANQDNQWSLLETVAVELYRTRETLSGLAKALNHERLMREQWQMEHYHRTMDAHVSRVIVPDELAEDSEAHSEAPVAPVAPIEAIIQSPRDVRMLNSMKGILSRGPPQMEALYHQCKRHEANIKSLMPKISNDKALNELQSMTDVLFDYTQSYRNLFALPEMPPSVTVGKRTNSLPPATPTGQQSSDASTTVPNGMSVSSTSEQDLAAVDHTSPEALLEEPTTDIASSFLLEDDDDLDEEVYTNDALIDVRRSSLLAEHRTVASSEDDLTTSSSLSSSGPLKGRGHKPSPLSTAGIAGMEGGERSPSSLASPLEKLRKAAEEEEGEVLRRGKDLLENGLENGVIEETLTGEELKSQILGSDNKT